MDYIETPTVSMASPDLLSDLKTCQAHFVIPRPLNFWPLLLSWVSWWLINYLVQIFCSVFTCSKATFWTFLESCPPQAPTRRLYYPLATLKLSPYGWCVPQIPSWQREASGGKTFFSSSHHSVCSACNSAFCVLRATVAISAARANTRMLTAFHKLGTGKGAGGPEPEAAPRVRSDCEGYVF